MPRYGTPLLRPRLNCASTVNLVSDTPKENHFLYANIKCFIKRKFNDCHGIIIESGNPDDILTRLNALLPTAEVFLYILDQCYGAVIVCALDDAIIQRVL